MKYINQLDYPHMPYVTRQDMEDPKDREYGKTTTVATSACGLCTAIVVVDRLVANAEFTLQEAIQMSYDLKANRRIGTNYQIFAPALAERFGLELEMTNDPERLRYCLRTGGCAVAESCGDRDGYIGLFTHTAHYINVIAERKDGRIVVLDPALKAGKYEEEGRKGKVEVDGVFLLSEMQYLAEDVANLKDAFFLFWRK